MSTTDDTVTVFDATRSHAIALLTESRYKRTIAAKEAWDGPVPTWVHERCREMATEDIDQLLAARSSTTCPDCKGLGITGGPGSYYDTPGKGKPCNSCDGSGTVTRGPLLLDLVAERIGDEIQVFGSRALFVAREST